MNAGTERPLRSPAEPATPWQPGTTLNLSPQQAEAVVRLVEAAQSVSRRHQFFVWSQGQLHRLLPHVVMVCGAYQRQSRKLRYEVFQSVVLSADALAVFSDGGGALMRAAAAAWVQGRGWPLLLDAERLNGEARAQVLKLRQESGIAQLLVHGVARPQRPTEIESLFVFAAGESGGGGEQPLLHAELLVPYLHSTWRRVQATEAELARNFPDAAGPAPATTDTSAGTPLRGLTGREVQILVAARDGLSNQQIGAALGISPLTAKNHIQSILRKLGASNRAHAVALAMAQGLLDAAADPS